jgi:multiple sugar transport system substrate-binding protein
MTRWDHPNRRHIVKGGMALTVATMFPGGSAFAQDENARIAAAAGKKGAKLKGMIWAPYYKPMGPALAELGKATGIVVDSIQDISIFDIPQRSMAEALSRSPEFDFFHVDAGMIPSLVSAGLLEPLDAYMKKANFKIDAVGDYNKLVTYGGKTYGTPTDGNVHTHFQRSDLLNDADAQKKFADKHGKPLKMATTWDEDFEIMKFFHDPAKEIWGSGNLRNRANGVTWWLMYFYSNGGFPFDDDLKPTLNTPAGQRALEIYLREKEVAHPESPGWGTPQMIPRIAGGKVVACQYWDGIIKLNENPAKSKTAGKWEYGTVPSGVANGKPLVRSISSPLAAILVNKYSPRKEQAAYLALWSATAKSANSYVADRVDTFHDAWHKSNMTDPGVIAAYTKPGLAAVEKNLQVASPPIYLTGYLEFQDLLGKALSETYVGQMKSADTLKSVEEQWAKVVKRIGTSKLKKDLATYKSVMPTIQKPT